MRYFASACSFGTAILILSVSGCDQETQQKIAAHIGDKLVEQMEQELREKLVQEIGPWMLASVVGASAPNGGPSVLNGLFADLGWRMIMLNALKDLQFFPSPLDVPNSNKPVRLLKPRSDNLPGNASNNNE